MEVVTTPRQPGQTYLIHLFPRISLLLTVFTLSSCAGGTNETRTESPAKAYQQLALEKYGDRVEYTANASGSLMLCSRIRKTTSLAPQRTVDLFVYDLRVNKVIFEESVVDGDVAWKDDRRLQITIRPGIIPGEDAQKHPLSFLVDVRTHERTPLSEDVPIR